MGPSHERTTSFADVARWVAGGRGDRWSIFRRVVLSPSLPPTLSLFSGTIEQVCLTLNLRHIGMVYCNGKAVGGQFCYSHNAISAGAMHAADFTWAGKKVYVVTPKSL